MFKTTYETDHFVDNEMYSLLVEDDSISEEVVMEEMDTTVRHLKRYTDLKILGDEALQTDPVLGKSYSCQTEQQEFVGNESLICNVIQGKRKFKLPRMELQKTSKIGCHSRHS